MTKIMGKSVATAKQMELYLLSVNPNPQIKMPVLEFCQLFLDVGAKEDVRGDVLFAQGCKETGNFKFKGTVTPDQNNYAGIGTTSNEVKGAWFPDEATGILAQAQHAKTYATTDDLNLPCVDPRRTEWFVKAKGGTSPDVETLGGSWAVPGYNTNKYSSLEDANKARDSYGYQIIDILNNILKIETGEEKIMTTIAVGAGHGSWTAGKRTVDGYKEHYINVQSAYYCTLMLQAHGIKVIQIAWDDLNAKDDSDVALTTRQNQVKAAGCDYSISFHANAHGNGSTWTTAQGVSTHYHLYSQYRGDSKRLATAVQKRLVQGTAQKNRGTKAQDLAMCNCTKMGTKASVLVEIGFMTNYNEAMLMKTTAFCKEQGEDAARGILDYLGIPVKATTTTSTKNDAILADTYTVVKGDSMSRIGAKLDIDWKELAAYNGIKYPYSIYVGQVLKLPVTEVKDKPVEIPSAGDFDLIFNATFYNDNHDDLKAAFNGDKTALMNHFKTYGMKEGRKGCATFDVKVYKEKNPDLQAAFGNAGYEKYFDHYLNYGFKENRVTV